MTMYFFFFYFKFVLFFLEHKHKNNKKRSLGLGKKRRQPIWINNRQKPIDQDRYCSICRHEFTRRSNFLTHVRKVHKGKLPPKVNEQDQSLLEMNDENYNEHSDHHQNETTNDQSGKYIIIRKIYLLILIVVVFDGGDTEPLQLLVNQWDINENRLRPRTQSKTIRELPKRAKAKCDICNKIYRMDYLKVSFS